MSWAGVVSVYNAHLVTAGATLSPKITTVLRGQPVGLTTVPVISYWWGGRRESTTGGNTLTRVNVEEALVTMIYVPESVRLPNRAETIEDYLRGAVDAFQSELWGDVQLGGNAIGISELDAVESGWVKVSVDLHGIFFTGNPVGRLHRNVYDVLKEEGDYAVEASKRELGARQRTYGRGGSRREFSGAAVILADNIVKQPMRMRRSLMRVVVSANYGL